MNINVSDSQLMNSLLNRNAMKRLSGVSILNIRKIPGLKAAGDALGVDVTLSDEARAMLRELNAKRAVDTMFDTPLSPAEATDDSKVNDKGRSEGTQIEVEFWESNKSRLLSAFWGHVEADARNSARNYGWNQCFGRLEATYAEMVAELRASYSGAELEKQLNQLSEDFKQTMEVIAQSISSILIKRAFDGQELPDWLTGLLDGDLIDMLNNIDFNSPSAGDAVNAFINSVMAFMARIAESIQQSVLGSGTDSDTEEVKRSPSTS